MAAIVLSVDATAARQNGSTNADTSSKARDAERKVAIRQLDDQAIPPCRDVAQIGKLILGVAGERAGIAVEGSRLADQIERDIGERQFLLEGRRVPGPFRQSMSRGSAHHPPGTEAAGRAVSPRQD